MVSMGSNENSLCAARALRIGVASCFAVVALCSRAWADELVIVPSVELQGRVDNNPLLQVQGSKTLYLGQITPRLTVRQRADRYDLSLSASANLRGYTGLHGGNPDDEQLDLATDYSTTELTKVGIRASVNRVTLLNQLEDNTGRLTRPARATNVSVSPHAILLADPVDEVEIAGSFNSQTYDAPQLQNYREYGASTTWSHTFNDIDTASVDFVFKRIEPSRSALGKSELYAARIGFSRKLPGRMTAHLSVGPQFVHRDLPAGVTGISSSETGYTADLSISDPIDELTNVVIDFNHQASPNSTGRVSVRDAAGVSVSRRLTPLISLNLSGNYTHSESGSTGVDNLKDLFGVDAGLNFQLSYTSSLSLGYFHRRETFRTTPGVASSDGVYLALKRSFGSAHN